MTTYTNETSRLIYASVAGFACLFYIAAGITSMNLADQSQMADVLSLLMSFSALVLGVTLYALTRDQGPALAMMALVCRVLEAVPAGEPAMCVPGVAADHVLVVHPGAAGNAADVLLAGARPVYAVAPTRIAIG